MGGFLPPISSRLRYNAVLEMTLDDVLGTEFDRFAVDQNGCIGHFATAGYGSLPKNVLENLSAYQEAEAYLLTLPFITNAVLPDKIEGDKTDWINMAKRGLFSYDWQHWNGQYKLIAYPAEPISLSVLSACLQDMLKEVRFDTLRFDQSNTIEDDFVKGH